MKVTTKSLKSLVGYSIIVGALLLAAVPALANSASGTMLDFSLGGKSGHTMRSALPLTPGMNVSQLNSGEENWYVFDQADFSDAQPARLSLALRYQSEARITPEEANFQMFSQSSATTLYQPQPERTLVAVGAPSPIRDTQQHLAETFWAGDVTPEERYYIRVYNSSPFGLEYTLEATPESEAVTGALPAGLGSAIGNTEALSARQLAWTLTAQAVNNMDAQQAARWMQQAQAAGWLVTAGTSADQVINPGEVNPQTLWQLTAEAIEGQEADTAANWLIQADALGWLVIPPSVPKNPIDDVVEVVPDDGDGDSGGSNNDAVEAPAVPAPPDDVYAPVNIYPNNPLSFNFEAVNSGRLAPYGEHWYELRRDDLDQDLIEDLEMTMFFTPSKGFISNRINFEIFPAGQYHIWQRGDADYMENIGAGMWVSRDKDPNTSERLWSGSLVDGDRYLVKIKNGTDEVVDYYLFPNDVTNAELGNPILHQGDQLAGRVPYAAAPPTRPGPPPEPGSGPPEALPLKIGTTTATLEAGEEIWYKFTYTDPNKGQDETDNHDFIFYMTNTPLDDIRARHADFEIYPGNQLHYWARGTIDRFDPLGASAPATFAQLEDERSLRVLWSGQLMEEHIYYVKVYNHDIGPLEYELEVKGGP